VIHMRKKAIILIIGMLLVVSTISFSVSSVAKTMSQDEPNFSILTNDLSADLAVKESGGSTWMNSASAKIGKKLDFKISISTSEGNMMVAIQLPRVDDGFLLDYVELSASSLPIVKTDEAIVWAFYNVPPDEITFKAEVKKTGTGTVGLTVGSTEDPDIVEEDSVQVSGEDKSRSISDLGSDFMRIREILSSLKSYLFKVIYTNKLSYYIILM